MDSSSLLSQSSLFLQKDRALSASLKGNLRTYWLMGRVGMNRKIGAVTSSGSDISELEDNETETKGRTCQILEPEI